MDETEPKNKSNVLITIFGLNIILLLLLAFMIWDVTGTRIEAEYKVSVMPLNETHSEFQIFSIRTNKTLETIDFKSRSESVNTTLVITCRS